ncbi:ABC transporter permease [Magnetospira sp. QH-2]|uniref:ABC transporter permease n=1 Tax=Magnetospira sp. (strain QH-2) TaxID=1288970 RepID=UPI0003E8194F|nr:ABC transporter permease [Magnetospira sp. QH-2]CCQ74704.1 Putative ABC transporter permease protein [Magnetospira sp. QH-2]
MSGDSILVVSALLTIVTAATPLILAATGELVTEKSGVLNLGVEGMMVVGAVTAFMTGITTDNSLLAVVAGAAGGAAMALLFAVLTLTLMANQVATGLALTLFGLGLSALLGHDFVGESFHGLDRIHIHGLTEIPVIGPLLFGLDPLVYVSMLLVAMVWWFLQKTRGGMILRAVGENHEAAHLIGYRVVAIRYAAVTFGGALSGLGGAYLSLVYTPLWVENMTAGRGWIALALVVFASWRPWRVILGAYLFGGITIIQLHVQGAGIDIAPQFLAMLPYLATILVLAVISSRAGRHRLSAPACLGRQFHASG